MKSLWDLEPSEKTGSKIRRQTCTLLAVLGGFALFAVASTAGASAGPVAEPDERRLAEESCAMTVTEQDALSEMRTAIMTINPNLLEWKDKDTKSNPRLKSESSGYIVLLLFGILYMFAGIAIVCDEFFVPALEKFVDEFDISMDVAGATFMAAGGSMPELATSGISTFMGAGEVGFAAIVGSAVFNVLFVIAVCAIFNSTDALELTWWPLARDCSFYLIALFTVVLVFGITSPKEIQTWEAALLLGEYILYCTFMKFNGTVHDWVEAKLSGTKTSQVADAPDETPSIEEQKPAANANESAGNELAVPGQSEKSESGNLSAGQANLSPRENQRTNTTASKPVNMSMPRSFRQSIVQLLTKNTYLYETAGIAAVTEIKGDLEETFKQLDSDNSGYLGAAEIKLLLEKMGLRNTNNAAIETALRRITRNGEGYLSFEAFKNWYVASEARIAVEVNRVFDEFDSNKNQRIEIDEIAAMLKAMGHTKLSTDELGDLLKEVLEFAKKPHDELGESPSIERQRTVNLASPKREDGSSSTDPEGKIVDLTHQSASQDEQDKLDREAEEDHTALTFQQFSAWYMSSFLYKDKLESNKAQAEAEEDGHMTLEPPDPGEATMTAMFWYVFTYPLCAILYVTLPDIRNPKYASQKGSAKVAILQFTLCLFWIIAFCIVLYDCTVVVSNTIGIPPPVSAVTVLAAGTSIPDLLSSYIVARQGEGDMAVSSSIGSNIFDVTVGLPLPWLLYNIINGKPAPVESNSLGFSVLILIVMLASVITTIKCMKWKMTKSLGYVMLALYFIFLVQELLNQMPEGESTLKKWGIDTSKLG
jgi:K+-dependent Na+/Ca+ exchanger-like protein